MRTTGTRRELTQFNLDMPLQHEGINTFLFLGKRTEGDGTGDVGGAVEILGAAVEQEETLWPQEDIAVGRCLIMHDGPVCLIAGYGIEGYAFEERLLCPESCQFLVNAQFGLLIATFF